ncbi:MAG TPA: helix-turn-helix domain-containing protein [Ktedonobacteraceae bacterium]
MSDEFDVPELPGYLSIKKAAQVLGVQERRVYKYIEAGKLQAFRVDSVHMISIEDLESFRQGLSGRPRKKTPAWHIALGKSMWLHVFVNSRPGHEKELDKKLEAMRLSSAHTFPGTAARYVARSDQRPQEVQILLVWRGSLIPTEEAREAELEELRRDLADVVNWRTARYETAQVLMHT